ARDRRAQGASDRGPGGQVAKRACSQAPTVRRRSSRPGSPRARDSASPLRPPWSRPRLPGRALPDAYRSLELLSDRHASPYLQADFSAQTYASVIGGRSGLNWAPEVRGAVAGHRHVTRSFGCEHRLVRSEQIRGDAPAERDREYLPRASVVGPISRGHPRDPQLTGDPVRDRVEGVGPLAGNQHRYYDRANRSAIVKKHALAARGESLSRGEHQRAHRDRGHRD